jgi:hypothetical protein
MQAFPRMAVVSAQIFHLIDIVSGERKYKYWITGPMMKRNWFGSLHPSSLGDLFLDRMKPIWEIYVYKSQESQVTAKYEYNTPNSVSYSYLYHINKEFGLTPESLLHIWQVMQQ